ncbi:MAG: DNA polymerase I [Bdellovibrionaceae bacterium]|nr:DNA polymerase I [Pseudobdellovibrionaceae bacterium]
MWGSLYLVDVSSMFFRAFYAVRPLTSPSGLPVSAIYGFLSMLVRLLKEENPRHIVFCYDRKEPSFRASLYPDYKANRAEMPEDLARQIPYIKRLAELLGIPTLEVPGYEADDIIGTLSRLGPAHRFNVVIVSGDKDFGQLVGPHVRMYDSMKGVWYDEQGVKEKWGVPPSQIIDYLALVGDSSDNIPGAKGIGPKGAIKLLETWGSLDAIYENLDRVEPKSLREKLEAAKEDAYLSRRLVTIVQDLPLSEDFSTYARRPVDREGLKTLLQELNFKSFESSLLGEDVPSSEGFEAPLSAQKDGAESFELLKLGVEDLRRWLAKGGEVWLFSNEAGGVHFARDREVVSPEGESRDLGAICNLFSDLRWAGFDLKSFWHSLELDCPVTGWDSALAAYVLESSPPGSFREALNRFQPGLLPEFPSPLQIYQAHRAFRRHLEERVGKSKLEKLLLEIEFPLSPVLYRMERRGIRIDLGALSRMSEELSQELRQLEAEIHRLAGGPFNIASPKQLGFVLFEKLGLPPKKKTKTGYSTDDDVLESLKHPVARLVREWREISKLKSTYVDALPQLADKGGRVHTTFNQALTTTGRLSSIHPNLQNIPIRTPRGQKVRACFVSADGQKLLSADYSQIELRVLAHISEDPGLIRAFSEDLDVHAATASEIFGVKLADVTSEQRRTAKAVNFGIAYGQGAFGLSETLGIGRKESQEIIDRYFSRFPGVRRYIEETVKTANEKGWVETLSGRRRYIRELESKNQAVKKFGERAAINAPIQGTAADFVKMAMVTLDKKVDVPMLLQVHDELVFEGSENKLREKAEEIAAIMESVAKLKVPLKVNWAIGQNWEEAH